MSVKVKIDDWINYNPRVGVEMLTISGLPGWGKTNAANSLVLKCFKKGELWIIPGDRFCEWRHFILYPSIVDEIIVLIPSKEVVELNYHAQELIDYKKEHPFIEVNYDKLNVMDYFPDDGKTRLLVVYDAHYKISGRAILWTKITNQLLNRNIHIDKCIGILFNEAGVLFPQNAAGDHWKAVEQMAEAIVDSRKGLVRLIFISQLQTEIKDTIRKKAMFKMFRKGWAGRQEPIPLQKATPFTARNRFHLSIGGLYVKNSKIDLFEEIIKVYKIIPSCLINVGGAPQPDSQKKSVLKAVEFKKNDKIQSRLHDSMGRFAGNDKNPSETVNLNQKGSISGTGASK